MTEAQALQSAYELIGAFLALPMLGLLGVAALLLIGRMGK